jgi:hypothetical protein
MKEFFKIRSNFIQTNSLQSVFVNTNNMEINDSLVVNGNINMSGNFNRITDGVATLSGGTLSNALEIESKLFTDGTSTLSNGTLSNVTVLDFECAFTDGTTTISGGSITGAKEISSVLFTDSIATLTNGSLSNTSSIKSKLITDGFATLSNGNLTKSKLISCTSLTDGTATLTNGDLKMLNLISSSTITDGDATLTNGSLENLNSINSVNMNISNNLYANRITDGTTILTDGTLKMANLISSETLTDGTTTITNGYLTNNNLVSSIILTDGTANLSNGSLTSADLVSSKKITDGTATLSSGTISGNYLTDGTLILTNGNLSTNSSSKEVNFYSTNNNTAPYITINSSGALLNNAPTPINDNNLVTVKNLSAVTAGLNVKAACLCATTNTTFSGCTLGTNTTGNGRLIVTPNLTVIDGFTLTNGDRILVKNAQDAQSNGSAIFNGIYNYSNTGSWERTNDLPDGDNAVGAFTFIELGVTNNLKAFIQSNVANTDDKETIVGIDAQEYQKFSNFTIELGQGLEAVGSTPTTIEVKKDLTGFLNIVQSNTLTDGITTLTSGNLTGLNSLSTVNANILNNLTSTKITDGTATLTSGNLTKSKLISCTTFTDGTININKGTLTNGKAIYNNNYYGTNVSLTNKISAKILTDGFTTITSGNITANNGTFSNGLSANKISSSTTIQSNSVSAGTFTGGNYTGDKATLTGLVTAGSFTTNGNLTANTIDGNLLTDGTATLTNGNLSTNNVTAGSFTGGNFSGNNINASNLLSTIVTDGFTTLTSGTINGDSSLLLYSADNANNNNKCYINIQEDGALLYNNSSENSNAIVTRKDLTAISSGLQVKAACLCATVSNTFSNSTLTQGTINNGNILINPQFSNVIDGVTLSDGDRIIIKDAQTAAEVFNSNNAELTGNFREILNGIYIYNSTPITINSVTYSSWQRSNDFIDGSNQLGAISFVDEGTTNATTTWSVTLTENDNNSEVIVGTDPVNFVKFSSLVFDLGQGLEAVGSAPTTIQVKSNLTGFLNNLESSTISDGIASLSSGTLTKAKLISSTIITDGTTNITSGTITANKIDAGTYSGGSYTGTNATFNGTLTAGSISTNGTLTAGTVISNIFTGGSYSGSNATFNGIMTANTFTDGTLIIKDGDLNTIGNVTAQTIDSGSYTGSNYTGTNATFTDRITANTLTDGKTIITDGDINTTNCVISGLLTDGTAVLSTGTLSTNEITTTLITVSTLTDGTAVLSTGTLTTNEINTSLIQVSTLTDGTAVLSTGTLSLNELTDDTATLSEGTLNNALLVSSTSLTDGFATLSSGTLSLNKLTDDTATLSEGTLNNALLVSSTSLTDGVANLSSGTLSLNKLTDDTATLSEGTLNNALLVSSTSLTDGITTLSSGNIFSNNSSGPKIYSDASQISSGLYLNVTDEVVQVKNAPTSYATSGGDTLVRFTDLAAAQAGIKFKEECVVATISNTFTGATLSYNGSGGLYGQLTISGIDITVIDGFTLTVGNRILVKDAQNATTGGSSIMNGIYAYAAESGGTQVWNRTSDVPNGVDEAGFLTFVSEGDVNGGISWINNVDPSVIGTNVVTMIKFSTLKIQAGNGIEIIPGTPATVEIDPTGNFTAGIITATLSGNASTATYATTAGKVTNALTSGDIYINTFTYDGSTTGTISANAATGASGNTLVARDSNGDFSATTITAALSGNATTATTATTANKVANALTNGNYINTLNYNGSSPSTISVNAFSTNTISTVVARDNSGNFSAGTITAQKFNGPLANALTNGSYINTFTYDGSSTAVISANAFSTNNVNTLVARDSSGNFSAATITAALNGNATTATTATTANSLSSSASINTSGNITAANVSATTVTTTSDIRLKSDIRNLENSLDKVCQLRGVQYRLNDNENISIGMIAQEVEPIIPEVVTEDEDGFKGLQYQNIVSLLVESIKELKKEIEILKGNN